MHVFDCSQEVTSLEEELGDGVGWQSHWRQLRARPAAADRTASRLSTHNTHAHVLNKKSTLEVQAT